MFLQIHVLSSTVVLPFEVNAWVNQYLNSFMGMIIYPCPRNGLIISKQSDQSLNHITIEIDNKLFKTTYSHSKQS